MAQPYDLCLETPDKSLHHCSMIERVSRKISEEEPLSLINGEKNNRIFRLLGQRADLRHAVKYEKFISGVPHSLTPESTLFSPPLGNIFLPSTSFRALFILLDSKPDHGKEH